jgi:pimeloyl-ACP methyl ester carboxylesterase
MGSFVARRIAELHPQRVRRLVLIDSTVSADNVVLCEAAQIVREVSEPVPG